MSLNIKLVLLTGANGFLGTCCLDLLLKEHFSVRATARTQEKADFLRKQFPSIETVVIPDQTVERAYDEAVKGVDGIIHAASPFVYPDAPDRKKFYFEPAVKMTVNMLKAAQNERTVKRVVVTSSFAAVLNPKMGGGLRDYTYTAEDWNPMGEKDALEAPDFRLSYMVSKTLAERAAWDFMRQDLHFDLVTMNPPAIFGRTLQQMNRMSDINTSMGYVYAIFNKSELPADRVPQFVNVDDAALAHVRALQVREAGGKRYLLSGGSISFKQMANGVRARYPELKDRIPEGTGEIPTMALVDTTPAEKELGITFKGFEKTILEDSVGQLLELEQRFRS